MLTKKQTALYWRTWAAVCTEHGWRSGDSDRRHAMHAQAHAAPSMRSFDNRDLDRFLTLARSLLTHTSARTTDDAERKRLLWRIRHDATLAGLSPAYLAALSTDLYGLACWDVLALDDLTNFRNAIHNRARKKLNPF